MTEARGEVDDVEDFRAARAADWVELAGLADRRGLRAAEAVRLSRLHRAAVADLALARRRWPGETVVPALEAILARSHDALYGSTASTRSTVAGVWRWVRHDLWRGIRAATPQLVLAVVVLAAAALAAGLWIRADVDAGSRLLPVDLRREIVEGTWRLPVSALMAVLAVVGGVAGGVGAIVVLVWTGAVLGAAVALGIDADQGPEVAGMAVAAVPLLSAIVTTAGVAMAAGWPGRRAAAAPPWRTRVAEAAVLVAGTAPLAIVGGLLVHAAEAPPEREPILIGGLVAVVWWVAIVSLGRGPSGRGTPGTPPPGGAPVEPTPPTPRSGAGG